MNVDTKIKVMIVDDQEVIREAFGMLLSNDESVDLIRGIAGWTERGRDGAGAGP
tara:strand:- start:282 stop:443 length:162 start_codon:yes stop_codon:yes gene_type:complete